MRKLKSWVLLTLVICLFVGVLAQTGKAGFVADADSYDAPIAPPLSQPAQSSDVAATIEQIEQRWKKQFEDYFQGKLTSEILPAVQIARSLTQINQQTKHHAALIYAIPQPDRLDLILVLESGKLIQRKVPAANPARLLETIQAFRMGILRPDSQPDEYLEPGQQLYEWLIGSIATELGNTDLLIFCLGSGLRSLPISALHDGKQFLIEKYQLAIIPAFNLLDRTARNASQTQVLAMGASTFNNQSALPGVPIELAAITQAPWNGKQLLNQDFTLKNLRRQRASFPYSIVHFATHAEFAAGTVDRSYIQFWNQQLRLDQFKELGLQQPPVQLLVLSACRTALGDRNAELGFAGLAVQAGSKAAIASLWSVSDLSTPLLMQAFYRHLKTSTMKAEALRLAQLEMLRNLLKPKNLPTQAIAASTNLSHPYHWAAFTLVGNPW